MKCTVGILCGGCKYKINYLNQYKIVNTIRYVIRLNITVKKVTIQHIDIR